MDWMGLGWWLRRHQKGASGIFVVLLHLELEDEVSEIGVLSQQRRDFSVCMSDAVFPFSFPLHPLFGVFLRAVGVSFP